MEDKVKKNEEDKLQSLLEDIAFVSFVKRCDTKQWEGFVARGDYEVDVLELARKIILAADLEQEVEIDVVSRYVLWEAIRKADKHHQRRYVFTGFVRGVAAACVAAVVALSFFLYRNQMQDQEVYVFRDVDEQVLMGQSMVVVSGDNAIEVNADILDVEVKNEEGLIDVNSQEVVVIDDKAVYSEVIVPYGKRTKIKLADNTVVHLNAGSRLAFPSSFEDDNRTVFLEGEAFFEVTRDEHKPFIVSAGNLKTEVLGTKFNVSAYREDGFVETILLEGKVDVWTIGEGSTGKISLVPNQKATYGVSTSSIELENIKNARARAGWINGWYSYSNENMQQVLRQLERYYNVKITYDSSLDISETRISGKLNLDESIETTLNSLLYVPKLSYKSESNQIVITKIITK